MASSKVGTFSELILLQEILQQLLVFLIFQQLLVFDERPGLTVIMDVARGPHGGLHGGVDPGMRLGSVLSCKVHPALVLKESLREISELVRGEGRKRPLRVLVQLPLLYHVPVAGVLQVLLSHLVDVCQVLEHQVQALFIREGQEELRVIVPGVGGQDHPHATGEVVAGVVDEPGRAVGDGVPSSNAVLLPEFLSASQHYFGGTCIVDGAEGVGFGRREWWEEFDVPGGFGGRSDKDVICGCFTRDQGVRSTVKHPNFASLRHDFLHRAVEFDDIWQGFVEGFGQLVKTPCDFVKAERKKREVRKRG